MATAESTRPRPRPVAVRSRRPVAGGAAARRCHRGCGLPRQRAQDGRPGRARVPLRPVRPLRLHGLERRLVRRPSHARVQRAVPAARRGCVGPAVAGASERSSAAAAFEPLARGHFGPSARWGVALVRRRHLDDAVHRPAAVRAGRRARDLLAARAPARPHGAGGAAGHPLPPRQPGGGRVPRARGGGRPAEGRSRLSPLRPARGGGRHGAHRSCWWRPSRRAGAQPYALLAFLPVLVAMAMFVLLLPRAERTLRIGAALYALRWRSWPMSPPPRSGDNASRLGELMAGPVALCALLAARREMARAGRDARAARPARLLAAVRPGARADERRGRPVALPRLLPAARGLPSGQRPAARARGGGVHATRTGRRRRSRFTSRWPAAGSASSTASRNPLFYDGTLERAARTGRGSPTTRSAGWRCRTRSSTTAPGGKRQLVKAGRPVPEAALELATLARI